MPLPSSSGRRVVVLGHVGADAQVPLRQADQLDRARGIASRCPRPRPGSRPASSGSSRTSPRCRCRGRSGRPRAAPGTATATSGTCPGSELMKVRDQSKENPSRSSWPRMCSARLLTHSLGGSPLGDRRQLGGQAEGVEAEREQDVVAAGPAEAGVCVPDRVAADVADVDVPGGERGRRLDVDVGGAPPTSGGVAKASRSDHACWRRGSSSRGSYLGLDLSLIFERIRAYPRPPRAQPPLLCSTDHWQSSRTRLATGPPSPAFWPAVRVFDTAAHASGSPPSAHRASAQEHRMSRWR